ncbi:aspartate aminotransferase family protein [Blastococcus mobilis]|uniref:4-aminobutyrate aminotransferase n=1 Tax=Blastococcus mobilis TaxID=1938746 RepID=A0A238UQ01_9ACTN|nr:aminotransferase class III-fold pyridoxal phosphate-dependent enzyme [Blastococcus mobilis]SNR24200.1 4-aminobutyrate aminotransferase [Blastococcus mobilis]
MHEAAERLYDRDRIIAGVEKLRFFPLALESGQGSWLVEAGGRRLLDMSATWTACCLGHGHPAVREALLRAAAAPPGAGALSAVHEDAVALAEELLKLTPGSGDRRVYLGHAGTDANDVAVRCAVHATGRPKVLAFEHSYHGGIGVAMKASGVHVEAGSVAPDEQVLFTPYPDPYRNREGYTEVLTALDEALAGQDVACLLVEPILSDGGLVVPPDGFLADVAARCAATGTLLICDEVKVGLGRPGSWHAFTHDGITPDIVTFGKSLGAGVPISAAVGPAGVFDEPGASALLTQAGNPYSAATARAVLATMTKEGLVERAAAAGRRLRHGLRQATAHLDVVGEVRGRGLAIGVDLVTDRASRGKDPRLVAKTVYRVWELGGVVFYVGGNVLEVTPPLVITDEEVDRAVELLAQGIEEAAAGKVSDAQVAPFAGW